MHTRRVLVRLAKHIDHTVGTCAGLFSCHVTPVIVAVPDAWPSLRLQISLYITAVAETALPFVFKLIDEQVLARVLLVQLLMTQLAIDRGSAWMHAAWTIRSGLLHVEVPTLTGVASFSKLLLDHQFSFLEGLQVSNLRAGGVLAQLRRLLLVLEADIRLANYHLLGTVARVCLMADYVLLQVVSSFRWSHDSLTPIIPSCQHRALITTPWTFLLQRSLRFVRLELADWPKDLMLRSALHRRYWLLVGHEVPTDLARHTMRLRVAARCATNIVCCGHARMRVLIKLWTRSIVELLRLTRHNTPEVW